MHRLLAILLTAGLLCPLAVATASAQGRDEVDADISAREIAIESSFTGIRVVVFGATRSRRDLPGPNPFDVVVVIRGPEAPVVAWRKERVAGIWVNSDEQSFNNVPSYYAIASSRPLADIASIEQLKKLGLGLKNLDFAAVDRGVERRGQQTAFRDAVIRIKQEQGLYHSDENGVAFIGDRLFRATVALPANVPVGEFGADVYLFRHGELLDQDTSRLVIFKHGFERLVYSLAYEYPLLYGIVAVILAIMAGLIASALFRRD